MTNDQTKDTAFETCLEPSAIKREKQLCTMSNSVSNCSVSNAVPPNHHMALLHRAWLLHCARHTRKEKCCFSNSFESNLHQQRSYVNSQKREGERERENRITCVCRKPNNVHPGFLTPYRLTCKKLQLEQALAML